MSTCYLLYAIPDKDIQAILEKPIRFNLMMFGEYHPKAQNQESGPSKGLLGKVTGFFSRKEPTFPPQPKPEQVHDHWTPEDRDETIDLDRSWHMIHFLLCGEAGEGRPPMNFLSAGGAVLGTIEEAPIRAFTSHQVQDIAHNLEKITQQNLINRFDHDLMKQQNISGITTSPDDDLECAMENFEDLQQFIKTLCHNEDGMYIHLM